MNPSDEMTPLTSSSSAASSDAGSGHLSKNSGRILHTCLAPVWFSMMHAARSLHGSSLRNSCMRMYGDSVLGVLNLHRPFSS